MATEFQFQVYQDPENQSSYKASPIVFKPQSTVTYFQLAQPSVASSYITMELQEDHNDKCIEFKTTAYNQLQGSIRPKNINDLIDKFVKIPTMATCYPEGDVIVNVREITWGNNNVNLVWPTYPGTKDPKPVRAVVKGKQARLSTKQFIEKMKKSPVKSVDVKHSWYATCQPDNHKFVTVGHRFELLQVTFE